MSKYTGLPDIDTAPDVYETHPQKEGARFMSDDDDDRESNTDAATTSDAIDTHSVNATQAAEKFRSTYLTPESYELHGTAGGTESTLARYMRLEHEVRELERILTARQGDTSTTPSMLAQLQTLERRIQRMRDDAKHADPRDLTQAMIDALQQVPEPVSAQSVPSATHMSAWDERLTALESRLGVQALQSDVPLADTIHRLEQQMQLLTQPRHLDTIIARAKAVCSELEHVDERRRHFANDDDEALAQVRELYALQSRIEPLEPLAPALLARLQTLAPLHSAASEFHTSLSQVEARQTTLQARHADLHTLLQKLEQSMQENQAIMQRNLQSLMTRLDTLCGTSPP